MVLGFFKKVSLFVFNSTQHISVSICLSFSVSICPHIRVYVCVVKLFEVGCVGSSGWEWCSMLLSFLSISLVSQVSDMVRLEQGFLTETLLQNSNQILILRT